MPQSTDVLQIDRTSPYAPESEDSAPWRLYDGYWNTNGLGICGHQNVRQQPLLHLDVSQIRIVRARHPENGEDIATILAHIWLEREDLICLDGAVLRTIRGTVEGQETRRLLKLHMEETRRKLLFSTVVSCGNSSRPFVPSARFRPRRGTHSSHIAWQNVELATPATPKIGFLAIRTES